MNDPQPPGADPSNSDVPGEPSSPRPLASLNDAREVYPADNVRQRPASLPPEPGTPRSLALTWLAAALVIIVIIAFNQFAGRPAAGSSTPTPTPTRTPTSPSTPAAPPAPAIAPPRKSDQLRMQAKLALMLDELGAGQLDAAMRKQLFSNVDKLAVEPVDQLRAAMAAAAFYGPVAGDAEAIARLDLIKLPEPPPSAPASPSPSSPDPDPDPDSGSLSDRRLSPPPDAHTAQLRADIATVRAVLEGNQVEPAALAALTEHHGWFGRLFQSRDLAALAPADRTKLVGNAIAFALLFGAFGLLFLVALFASLVCATIAIIYVAQHRMPRRFIPSRPGGSLLLEVLPVFGAGFILLIILTPAVEAAAKRIGLLSPNADGTTLKLIAQWALLPLIFWPVFRGMPFAEWRRRVGFTSGRGVLREVAAGLYGYLCGLPVLLCALVVTVILFYLSNLIKAAASGDPTRPSPQVENPIAELIGSAGFLQLALFFLLATVWAPIVEEAVFRGALFRHLRARLPLALVAPITAVFFGIMHSYPVLLLLPVMTIGFIFAFIREWRDSLIGPIVAHSLHNATILIFAGSLFSILGD